MKSICFVLIIFSFYSCNNKEDANVSKYKNNHPNYKIETSRDTFYINEYVKALAVLETPFFKKEDSKIIVILDNDDNYSLKKDLSNQYQISFEGFHNLSYDTINQKWFKGYDFNKSSAFGKKLNKLGENKIRGYILEYITNEPPLDSIYDRGKVKKYYFEKKVFIKE